MTYQPLKINMSKTKHGQVHKCLSSSQYMWPKHPVRGEYWLDTHPSQFRKTSNKYFELPTNILAALQKNLDCRWGYLDAFYITSHALNEWGSHINNVTNASSFAKTGPKCSC